MPPIMHNAHLNDYMTYPLWTMYDIPVGTSVYVNESLVVVKVEICDIIVHRGTLVLQFRHLFMIELTQLSVHYLHVLTANYSTTPTDGF